MSLQPVPPAHPLRSAPASGLAALPGVRTLASPRFRLVLAMTLATLGVLVLGAAMLRQASQPDGQFAIDFGDYHGAARALVATGSPYAAEMLAGPVDAQGLERYRYPPPLAQILAPLSTLALGGAAAIWLTLQAVAMVAAVWLALGAAGVPRHGERAAWSVVACLVFMPVFDTLWKGNVSGFVALAVTLVAMGGPAAGAGAAAGTLLKVVPGTFLPMLLVAGRRALVAAATMTAIVVGVSAVLSPAAWADYAIVLPNLLGGSADYATNVAPATLLGRAGVPAPLPDLARALSMAGALALTVMAPLVARRRPGFHGWAVATTLATSAMLLLPAAIWYHYLAALLPVAALAWPAAGVRARLALLGSAALITVGVAALPLATMGAVSLVVVAVAVHLRAPVGAGSPRPGAIVSRASVAGATPGAAIG